MEDTAIQRFFIKPSNSKETDAEYDCRCEELKQIYFTGGHKTWESYAKHRLGVCIFYVAGELTCCTCPSYLKYGLCKHCLGKKILDRAVEVPPKAKEVELVRRKRGDGRSSKATTQRNVRQRVLN